MNDLGKESRLVLRPDQRLGLGWRLPIRSWDDDDGDGDVDDVKITHPFLVKHGQALVHRF